MAGQPTIVCGASLQTSEAELEALLDAGVGEVYCGYVPPRWLERFGMEVSPNRRYHVIRQVVDAEMLRRFCAIVEARGRQLMVALNEHHHPPEAAPLLDEIVDTALEAGAAGFIVADIALLERLAREHGPDIELIASNEAGCTNREAARAWVERGARRIIMAREARIDEIEAIAGAFEGEPVAFEAFVAREFCVNSSSFCFATHGHGHGAYFCSAYAGRRLVHTGPDGGAHELPGFTAHWQATPRFMQAFSSLHRCGFCAIERLLAAGVNYLKVPGRSTSALDAVQRLSRLLADGDLSREACRAVADGGPEFCESGEYCYYELDVDAPAPRVVPVRAPTPASPPAPTTSDPRPAGAPELAVYLSLGAYPEAWRDGLKGGLEPLLAPAWAVDWERETAVRAAAELNEIGVPRGGPVERVVLGAELCALRWPRPRALVAEIDRWRTAGVAVSLVTPVAFQAIFDDVVAGIDAVLAAHPEVEIVINDLGVLRCAGERWAGHALSTGRLFNRMKRDQLADATMEVWPTDLQHPTDAPPASPAERDRLVALRERQRAVYGHPYLGAPAYQAMLRAAGVRRIATDVLPTPLSAPLPAAFEHTLYLPWTYSGSSRACPTATAVEDAVGSYPTRRCQRPCRDHHIEPEFLWSGRRVMQRGAATFIDCTRDVVAFARSMDPAPTRIVFEPLAPL